MERQEQPTLAPEYEVNLDRLPKQQHNWVKRGIKVSCEGAGHPHHSHFLTRVVSK